MIGIIRHYSFSGSPYGQEHASSYWVSDGSYLRGNLFSVGYTVGQDLLDKLGLNSIRVYASLANAFVIYSSDFKGYDPEGGGLFTSNANKFDQSIQFYSYPKSKTFTFGFNVQF